MVIAPANAQIAGDRSDRVGVLATRQQASARARSVSTLEDGQRPPARSRSGPCRPAHDSARAACAKPGILAGHQRVGHALDRTPAVEFGPHPAANAPDHGGRGLDGELPVAAHDFAARTSKPSGSSSLETELLQCCPTWNLSCRRQTSASYARSQVLVRRLLRHHHQHTAPRFTTKSRSPGGELLDSCGSRAGRRAAWDGAGIRRSSGARCWDLVEAAGRWPRSPRRSGSATSRSPPGGGKIASIGVLSRPDQWREGRAGGQAPICSVDDRMPPGVQLQCRNLGPRAETLHKP
jgi:hypothetical protein